MNLVIRVVLVVFAALFGIFAAANGQAGELKYSSEGESGDIRQVTIHSDGSLLSTTRLGPLVATTSISFDDRRIVITETDEATVTLVAIDKQATRDAQQKGLFESSQDEHSPLNVNGNKRHIFLSSDAGVIHNKSGNNCQAELDDLLSAADGMLSACGAGGGTIGALLCLRAQNKYREARDKYKKCIGPEEDQQGPM